MNYLTTEQLCFISLFTIGIRVLHADSVFNHITSATPNNLLRQYYADHHKYFSHLANFVLHLHQHFQVLYDFHGPLSSINTFAQEDFIGYISKNKNGTTSFDTILTYYYNIDVLLKNLDDKTMHNDNGNICFLILLKNNLGKSTIPATPMVQLQRTPQETSHRKIFNQAGGQAKVSQMSSTTEKPKRKTTDENFDATQRKRPKQFEPSSNHASSVRFDVHAIPVSLAKGSQRTQINTAQFNMYRARHPHSTVDTAQIRKQRKNVLQKQQINVMQAPQVNDYDDDHENELTTQNTLKNYDDDDNEDEQLTETMTQPKYRLSHPRNKRQRSYELIDEVDDSESINEREDVVDTSDDNLSQLYFDDKFNGLKAGSSSLLCSLLLRLSRIKSSFTSSVSLTSISESDSSLMSSLSILNGNR
ncbi:unnamed protein product [Rotaria magnacalcarata]|uniref:Uncharacterized protein n=1 Tax=Rotaria magnacalcarata TaxID=392030 RepID=A0A8S2S666_9BILA|nr:unnamed protein product [Rotaria magnacalcarata]